MLTPLSFEMHRLLSRQLTQHFGDNGDNLSSYPQEWQSFLQAVNEAYHQYDQEQVMLEHSLEISSQELLTANDRLREVVKTIETQVQTRTEDLSKANSELARTVQELKETQLQLIQTEKMSSLGQLVAGIAHEINNPINFIHGNLQYAAIYLADVLSLIDLYHTVYPHYEASIQARLEEIDIDFLRQDLPRLISSMQTGSERIRQLVLSLKNFSRMDEAALKYVDIHEGIESTLVMLQARLKSQRGRSEIQVMRQYGALPLVECYVGQLNQVFMNIIANSLDAVDERFSPGWVPPSPASLDLNQVKVLHPVLQQLLGVDQPVILIKTELIGAYAQITIADNGIGIDTATSHRLFDPFFTTKPVGKGTGLGLSISYQIIADHHCGILTCDSAPSLGTAFTIKIPASQSVFNQQSVSNEQASAGQALSQG